MESLHNLFNYASESGSVGCDGVLNNAADIPGSSHTYMEGGASSSLLGMQRSSSNLSNVISSAEMSSSPGSVIIMSPAQLTHKVVQLEARLAVLEAVVHQHHQVNSGVGSRSTSLRRRILDDHCLPLFVRMPDPPNVELKRVSLEIGAIHPDMDHKTILSQVRRWFRKKRDECSQRIYQSCRKILAPKMNTKQEIEILLQNLEHKTALLDEVLQESSVEIQNREMAQTFCASRINAFFKRQRDKGGK